MGGLTPRSQNRIKAQAHDHPGFRRFAARYGQAIHQLNMRLSVALLRNVEAWVKQESMCAIRFQVDGREYILAAGEADWAAAIPAAVA